MHILIVEQNAELGAIWSRFLQGQGLECTHVCGRADAFALLREHSFDALVLDMEMSDGDSFAVADFASYRNPDIPIIAVSARSFFSDEAIFELIPNARVMLREPLRLDDMAAMIEHYGAKRAASLGG